VPVVANLRHHDIEPLFNEQTIADGLPEFAFRDELLTLWQLANACEGRRGKPSAMQGNTTTTSASTATSPMPRPAGSRFPHAGAAARSTNWSPS
jgi:hypothetical protein